VSSEAEFIGKIEAMPTSPTETTDVSALSYEEARDELVRVVAELERGAATLEQSLGLWERGEALAARCEEWLIGAKTRLDAARAASTGTQSSPHPAAK
jgi:exodeoxyribonuclease VII small subunit